MQEFEKKDNKVSYDVLVANKVDTQRRPLNSGVGNLLAFLRYIILWWNTHRRVQTFLRLDRVSGSFAGLQLDSTRTSRHFPRLATHKRMACLL